MPNWVKNKVHFDNKKVIEDCYKQENGYELFDFNKVISMPESLHIPCGSCQKIAMVYAFSKMDEERKEYVKNELKNTNIEEFFSNYYYDKFFKEEFSQVEFDTADKELKEIISGEREMFENIDYAGLGIKNLEDLGNTYINNILEYGHDTWYDWSCDNWGTKWNACHTYYVDEFNIEFDTAWSTPIPIFKEISKKYNTRVEVEYADEDIGNNCGVMIFEDGELVSRDYGNREFANSVWGWTDEEESE